MRSLQGFTLLETVFALFIGLLLLGAIYTSMVSGQKSSLALEGKVMAHQDTRAALEVMALEIGMASYNRHFVPGIWRNPGNCGQPSAYPAYKGIPMATSNSITMEMDIGESGFVGDNPNEIISYVYDVANERITRETNCQGALPFLGDVPGSSRSVRVINHTLNMPVFRYFDGLGNEIAAANLPADIPKIKKIEIILATETEEVAPDTLQRRRMIYSTSVISRNHATN
ncbi:MAG: prepilin-type N-terminal cleavage/methylation domain-containing protein [Deltaproteobacteria bacterium]|nr:prepilin-type N-terminal cleavage/methylation domain-containing protein [Deltaproteobacteria bacterium]